MNKKELRDCSCDITNSQVCPTYIDVHVMYQIAVDVKHCPCPSVDVEDIENPSQVAVQDKGSPCIGWIKQPTSGKPLSYTPPVMDFLSSMPIPPRLNAILAQNALN